MEVDSVGGSKLRWPLGGLLGRAAPEGVGKWAFESITTNKASGGDGIPGELVQILKDDAVTVLHSLCQHIWKPPPWPQDWKRSVFIPIPKRGHAKACSTDRTLARLSHASRVVLTIPQARLPQYVNRELPDAQAGLRKGRGTREHSSCATIPRENRFSAVPYTSLERRLGTVWEVNSRILSI